MPVPQFTDMDKSNQTAVRYGFPGLFMGKYDVAGKEYALNLLAKAIDNDPGESSWYYARALFLGEVFSAGRVIDKMPSDEEFELLDKALGIEKNAMYTSHCAALYRQSAKELTRPVRVRACRLEDPLKIHSLNEKSARLYE